MRAALMILSLTLCVLPARADDVADAVTAAFLHELGHALIDVTRQRPMREEDAADELSVVLALRLLSDDRAAAVTLAGARVFRLYAAQGGAAASRGAHSPDADRARQIACLYLGARPDGPQAAAARGMVPRARRPGCAAAWAAVAARWDRVLRSRPPQDGGRGLRLVVPADGDPLARAIAPAVAAFNAEFGLPQRVDVSVEPCGSPDAFYDPRARRIVICTEYGAELARLQAAGAAGGG